MSNLYVWSHDGQSAFVGCERHGFGAEMVQPPAAVRTIADFDRVLERMGFQVSEEEREGFDPATPLSCDECDEERTTDDDE